MPPTKTLGKKRDALIDALGIAAFAIIIELIGRSIFSVYDTNNQVYGAKYWAETGMPWMHVWMGLDLMIGIVTKSLGDTLLAITIWGCIINAGTAVAIYVISKQLGINRFNSCAIAMVTGLWFLPHLGGWIGDNLSFLIGVSPALLYAATRQRWTQLTSIGLGLGISVGATVKLNAFLPAFAISCLWLAISLISKHSEAIKKNKQEISHQLIKHGITVAAVSLTSAAILNWLIATEAGLYQTVVETYTLASQSVASSQLSTTRLLSIPLGVNLIEAFSQNQKGVLIFSPLVLGFWVAITFSTKQLLTNKTTLQEKQLHSFALLLMLASAVACVGLGRGLTHRMLLLPAGVLISFSAFPLRKKHIQFWIIAISTASLISWSMFAWLQRTTDISSTFDSRELSLKARERVFCIGSSSDTEPKSSSRVVNAQLVNSDEPAEPTKKCWTSTEFQQSFAGLPYTQQIANGMGVVFLNERPGKTIFYEKWDKNQATQKGIEEWVNEEVRSINALQIPYFLERLELNENELAAPGYSEWQQLRHDRLSMLSKALNAHKIGNIGDVGVWETKWAQKDSAKHDNNS